MYTARYTYTLYLWGMAMSLTSFYPVLFSANVGTAADFFRKHFGFETTFESDWYASLRRGQWELAFVQAGHATVPDSHRDFAPSPVILNFEVDDVDAEHRRLVGEQGLTEVLSLRSEAFGQRHFIIAGPENILIDVITPIEPSEEFAAQYR